MRAMADTGRWKQMRDDRWDVLLNLIDTLPHGIALSTGRDDLVPLNFAARSLFKRHGGRPDAFGAAALVRKALKGESARNDVSIDDGTIIEVSAYEIAGTETRVAVVFHDVTSQRAGEAHLLETERARSLGEGLAGIAHELNNPLTAIIGFADLLTNKAPPELKELCEELGNQADRCLTLAKEVLAFSRRRVREDSHVDMCELIKRTRHLLKRELEDGRIDFSYRCARNAEAFADPRQIQQVLLNIVQNAVHAIVEAQPQLEDRKITVRTIPIGDRLQVEVRDTGPGIPNDVREQLFAPFFSTRPKGNGLGLSISDKIVREHGGRMRVSGEPGQTVFLFDIPLAQQPSAELPAPLPPLQPSSPRDATRVLLVDDEEPILLFLSTALRDLGYTVDTESNGAEALSTLLSAPHYDAVIMDVRMPPPTGLEILGQLQSQGLGVADRTVLMTGEVNEEILGRVREMGVAVLAKPFRVNELSTVLQSVLGLTPVPRVR
jgi:signal transduction histidine kinase